MVNMGNIYEEVRGEVTVGKYSFNDNDVVIIAGPCALENETQIEEVAKAVKAHSLQFIRAGIFKPRTSPYSFQGMGNKGLPIFHEACKRHSLLSVSEVTDSGAIPQMEKHIDVLQVGTRNMRNFELLKDLGKSKRPVLLKRGMSATIDEFLNAAEYILSGGNKNVILCERGIRTFESETRNTLDISAVPIINGKTRLPIIVDPVHATGRKDILLALSKAAIAAGANGLMVEVHPDPDNAKSDNKQQMNLEEFSAYISEIKYFCSKLGKKVV